MYVCVDVCGCVLRASLRHLDQNHIYITLYSCRRKVQSIFVEIAADDTQRVQSFNRQITS